VDLGRGLKSSLLVGAYNKVRCLLYQQVGACSAGWCLRFYKLVLVARIGVLGRLVPIIIIVELVLNQGY
jgi:hypothetical protein